MDHSKITTGLLSDYGLQVIPPEYYDGVLRDSNEVDISAWRSLYGGMYSSRFNSISNLPAQTDVFNAIAQNTPLIGQPIPIAVMCINYNRLRNDAFTSSMVSINSDQIYDVAGKNPYETKTLFAAAPLQTGFENLAVQFVLKSSLYYTNAGKTITSIFVDPGDGNGFRNASWDVPFSVSYPVYGNKAFIIKFSFSDGTTLQTHGKIAIISDRILKNNSIFRYYESPSLRNPFPANSNHSGGTAFVALSRTHIDGKIHKPIIIAKGWDPWKIFNREDLRITLETFLYSTRDVLGNIDYRQLGCLEVPINSQMGGGTLEGYLNDNGYDIVFLDYNDGTDDIKRNAKLLKDVIHWVNQVKVGNQPNVVLGISMGGLVARWALREMENENIEDHQTVKLITMDSPHKGANVPVGVQAALYHASSLGFSVGIPGLVMVEVATLSDIVSEIKQAMQVLNAPASKQMLIYNVSMSPYGNLSYNNSIHDAFQAEYDALGMPQKCQNIAISDGAGNNTTYFTPNSELLYYSANYSLKWWQEMLNIVASPLTGSLPLLSNYPQLAINIIPGKTEIKGECIINAIPSQPGRVYHARIYVTKKILWLIPVNVDITNCDLNSQSGMLPVDGVPGGGINVDDFIGQTQLPPEAFKQKTFCFVPAVSALGLKDWKNYLTTNLNGTNFITNGQTPFDSYFSTMPVVNYEHTQFNSSADYLLSKFANCQDILPGAAINGSAFICTFGTSVNITGITPDIKVNWDASPNITISNIISNPSIFTAKSSGNGWIKATLNNGCMFQVLPQTFNVWLGVPQVSTSSISNLEDMGYSNYYKMLPASDTYAYEGNLTTSVSGAISKGWSYISGLKGKNVAYWSASGTTVDVGAKTNNAGEVLRYTATNTCGSSGAYYTFFTGDMGTSPPPELIFTPNPATSQTEVSIPDNITTTEMQTTVATQNTYTFSVMNSYGVNVYTASGSEKKITVPTSSLKNGIYIVRVSDGTNTFQGNLVVNH